MTTPDMTKNVREKKKERERVKTTERRSTWAQAVCTRCMGMCTIVWLAYKWVGAILSKRYHTRHYNTRKSHQVERLKTPTTLLNVTFLRLWFHLLFLCTLLRLIIFNAIFLSLLFSHYLRHSTFLLYHTDCVCILTLFRTFRAAALSTQSLVCNCN